MKVLAGSSPTQEERIFCIEILQDNSMGSKRQFPLKSCIFGPNFAFSFARISGLEKACPLASLWHNNPMSRWILFLITVALGLGAGLFYGWKINPGEYINTTPGSLRDDYKADYVLMVAEAYQAEADLNAADRLVRSWATSRPPKWFRVLSSLPPPSNLRMRKRSRAHAQAG